jgi:hypothetical protein
MTYTSHLSNAFQVRSIRLPLFIVTLCVSTFLASEIEAQIKSPGAHQRYSVELEPHALVAWDVDPGDEGLGLGLRVSIPVIDNGPVTTINNSFAVGFGLDWAWSDDCDPGDIDCDAHNIMLPIVAQWNFFFTPVVSAFTELGFAVVFETWDEDYRRDEDDFNVSPELYFLVGPRFTFGNVAIPLRIGYPYILSIGVSFLI